MVTPLSPIGGLQSPQPSYHPLTFLAWPGPIDDEKREDLIAHLTAAILGIYR